MFNGEKEVIGYFDTKTETSAGSKYRSECK